jgi:hypothetical protein
LARGQLQLDGQAEPKANDMLAEAFAAHGLYCEDEVLVDEDEFWLWPENEDAFWFWVSIQTQWQKDMERRVGLLYDCVEAAMRMEGIRPKHRSRLYRLIRAMEHAALEEWATTNR